MVDDDEGASRKSELRAALEKLMQGAGVQRDDLVQALGDEGELSRLQQIWHFNLDNLDKKSASDRFDAVRNTIIAKLANHVESLAPPKGKSRRQYVHAVYVCFNMLLDKSHADLKRMDLSGRRRWLADEAPEHLRVAERTSRRWAASALDEIERQMCAPGYAPVEDIEEPGYIEETSVEDDPSVVADVADNRTWRSKVFHGKRAHLVLALACVVTLVAGVTVALTSGIFDGSDTGSGQSNAPGIVDGKPVPGKCQPPLGPLEIGQGNSVHVTLSVKTDDTPCWTPIVAPVSSGATFRYMISYQNNSNKKQEKVVARISLAPGLLLVPASTYLFNGSNPDGVLIESNNIANGGIVIGGYRAGAGAYVVLSAGFPFDADLKCGGTTDMRSVGVVRPEGMNEYYNTAVTQTYKRCG